MRAARVAATSARLARRRPSTAGPAPVPVVWLEARIQLTGDERDGRGARRFERDVGGISEEAE